MDSEDLCRWRAYLKSSTLTIFDIIENAIMVAALDQPQEFKARRERIVMKLYQFDLPSFSSHDSQLSEAGREFSVPSIRRDESQGSKHLSDRDDANVKYDGRDKDGEKVSCDGDSDDDSLMRDFCEDVTKQLSDEALKGTENDNVNEEVKTVKVDCLKRDTSSGAQVLSNETAKDNHSIKDNEDALMSAKGVEENDETLEEVSKIKKVLENSKNHNDEVIVELLRKLLRIDFNMEILKVTMIGEAVNPLGKHGLREIRDLARYLIVKWQVVVDEALDKPTSNADDKISESCLGDHNAVQDGSSNGKEPSLDLQQELPPDSFFEGLASISPSVASLDLLKIFDDVDEEHLFNILPPDDGNNSNELSFLEMLNVDEEQHIHEKPSVIEKKPELNPTRENEIRPRATPDGNGVQSQLKPDPLNPNGGFQASHQRANFGRKATTERALQAKENNLKAKGTIESKYKPDTVKTSHPSVDVKESNSKANGTNIEAKYNPDNTIKTSQKLNRTDDVDRIMTLEEASKVIKAGYQRVVRKRRVVQMLDLNDLNELNAKYQKK